MASRPTSNNNKPDNFSMDTFFDFNQGTTEPSPVAGPSRHWDAASPYDTTQERQQFSGPSHDYNQYKQQVGLPAGSVHNLPPQSMLDGYNSGIDMSFDGSWSTGIDMDADITMDFNNMDSNVSFFPTSAPVDNFVNPNSLGGEEPVSNVGRLWPGMHSQQAAMQKAAQSQAGQQRQIKTQFQQQQPQYRQPMPAPAPQSNGKRAAQISDPQVEERITRLLNQMRHNSTVSQDDAGSPSDLHPHMARMKKDEDDMDEDERLLASEEGKKLSSKERRQLRNKVSARAFRSRRKEYIGQLEGEVAVKAQEAATLRSENDALIQENERYRGFIETILRHPAFGPFMNDISKDPSMLGMQQQQQAPPPVQQQPTPQPPRQQPQQPQQEDTKPAFLNFDASQIQVPQQQSERVNLATIPEGDFSKLNLNGFQQSMDFNDFRSVNAFAVTDLPTGPEVASLFSTNSFPPVSTIYAQDNGMDMLLAKLDNAASRV